MSEDREAVLAAISQAVQELGTLGVPGLDGLVQQTATASDDTRGERERMEAFIASQVAIIDASLRILEGEMTKMRELATRTDDPRVGEMLFAYTEQSEGLLALKRFFSTGKRADLHAAREKITRGMRSAQAAGSRKRGA